MENGKDTLVSAAILDDMVRMLDLAMLERQALQAREWAEQVPDPVTRQQLLEIIEDRP